jgi:hypothetical protein
MVLFQTLRHPTTAHSLAEPSLNLRNLTNKLSRSGPLAFFDPFRPDALGSGFLAFAAGAEGKEDSLPKEAAQKSGGSP